MLDVLIESGQSQGGDPRCNPTDPIAYVAHQETGSVTIGVAAYYLPAASEAPGGYGCGVVHVGYRQLPVRLSRPLGTRTVIDGAGGGRHSVILAAAIPVPAVVPAGYVAEPVTMDDTYLGRVGGPVAAQRMPADRSDVLGLRTYRNGEALLEIREGLPQYLPQGGDTVAQVSIGRVTARLSKSFWTHCLRWTETRPERSSSAPTSTTASHHQAGPDHRSPTPPS